MPVYGPAPFLSQAIESVYQSQNVEIEFIIVLDRCTNSDYLKLIGTNPPNIEIKILVSEQPGIVPALNLGIINAGNEFIARLDADDLVISERFESQAKILTAFPEVVCLGTQLIFIDEQNKVLGHTRYPTKHKDVLRRMLYQNCIGHPSVMYRKSAVEKVGGYREILTGSEDYDLWLRLADIGEVRNLSQKLTKYRKSHFQFTNQISSRQQITESASRIYAAMRKLDLVETYPEKFESLNQNNVQNILKIRSTNKGIAADLMAAEYINSAYRDRANRDPKFGELFRVLYKLVLAGLLSPKILRHFIVGLFLYRSISIQNSNRSE